MGIGPFHISSSVVDKQPSKTSLSDLEATIEGYLARKGSKVQSSLPPNPDPYNYKILKSIQVGRALVVKIKYPDATNYEGVKVLVYKSATLTDLRLQHFIDPHFSKNKKFLSPFARFEPTKIGWSAALKLAKTL